MSEDFKVIVTESIAESQRKAATQVVKVLTGGQSHYPVRP